MGSLFKTPKYTPPPAMERSNQLLDQRDARAEAEEANAQVMLFSPLEALSKEEAATNVSYIDKMEDNLDSLKVALECQ